MSDRVTGRATLPQQNAGPGRTPPPPRHNAGPGRVPPPPSGPGGHRASVRRVIPRPKWIVAVVLLIVFGSALTVEAYANSRFVPDNVSTTGDQTGVPPQIIEGGPIINAAGPEPHSYSLRPKTIALTFDDGPDPWWTPKIIDVLAEYDVPATFFVVGTQVARHPQIVRALVDDGHEVGVHTFTHPDMAQLPEWRRKMEYSQTELAIAGAGGVHASLLRFPYSSVPDAIDTTAWNLIREGSDLGFLTVAIDTDSQDWARPGVPKIVENMTPAEGEGAVVLLHDAGGDRAETVAALRVFLPKMLDEGYTFVTVSDGLREVLTDPETGAAPVLPSDKKVTTDDQRRGRALSGAIRIADGLLGFLAVLFLVVGGLTIIRTVLLFVLAGWHARKRRRQDGWGPPVTQPVSVIVPAYNERVGIEAAVRSLAGGDHIGGIEVIVVDDGSSDGTADLVDALRLPNVRVVRKANGGKPSALNAGIAAARFSIIVMVDGDTVFEPDSLRRLVQPFADPEVGAVAGNVKVGNRKSLVGRWQHIEYVIGFNLDRRLYEALNCMPTIPGAIGAFRREVLVGIGGVSDDTLAEDTDMTMAIGRAGWRVVYEGSARAWTEAPTTLGQLWRQRYRWSYGTMQAMWKHRRSIFDKGPSGRFGRRCLPLVAAFGIGLPLLAPVIDLMAFYGLLFANRVETGVAWLAMLALQIITGMVAFRLDRERFGPLWTLPLQQIAYRQLMYLVLIQSTITAMTGGRLRWHKLRRTGGATIGAT